MTKMTCKITNTICNTYMTVNRIVVKISPKQHTNVNTNIKTIVTTIVTWIHIFSPLERLYGLVQAPPLPSRLDTDIMGSKRTWSVDVLYHIMSFEITTCLSIVLDTPKNAEKLVLTFELQ